MKLYKYVDGDETLARILDYRTLRFSNPADFNDPFDCVTTISADEQSDRHFSDFTATFLHEHRGLWVEYFRMLNGAFIPNTHTSYLRVPFSKAFFLACSLLADKRGAYIEATLASFPADSPIARLARFYATLKVSCFSSRWDNVSCWAHYSDDFRGSCVEIDFDEGVLAGLGWSVGDVAYVSQHPATPNASDDLETIIQQSVRVKHQRWLEESEVRLWFHGPVDIVQNPGVITKVYYGYRSPVFRESFNRYFGHTSGPIEFYLAVPSQDDGGVQDWDVTSPRIRREQLRGV